MTEKDSVLAEKLEEIIKKYPTPFHIYDEKAIRQNLRRLFKAFAWAPSFREHYAVKAARTPACCRFSARKALVPTAARSS